MILLNKGKGKKMKRYICRNSPNSDCYKEAILEILNKMKDLDKNSLILKSISLCENKLYRKLLLRTLNNIKNNKRSILLGAENEKVLIEDLNDNDTIASLLDGLGVNPIKIDNVEDISLFKGVQEELKELLSSPNCEDHIIQGWQFLTLYDSPESEISVYLCVFDDEMGLSLNMNEEESDNFIDENEIGDFYDVMFYGLAIIDYDKLHREFFLDVWS